jgi:hypothetical protein
VKQGNPLPDSELPFSLPGIDMLNICAHHHERSKH